MSRFSFRFYAIKVSRADRLGSICSVTIRVVEPLVLLLCRLSYSWLSF